MARILIVDDSPTECYKLREILEKHGHHVLEAANGADGVAMADTADETEPLLRPDDERASGNGGGTPADCDEAASRSPDEAASQPPRGSNGAACIARLYVRLCY